ncbi:MAG: RNA-guided pseudouridylation complex pseudouridine synthase subunit Cbf5 [Halobacteriales archaeon]|nr:RNA-guided pseudouridylation complex pseudouridine synthase subunit Cbf5 [Halobacteriales archaeon]
MPALRGDPADRTIDQLLEFGVVNLDKPPGPSAHQVSAWLQDVLDIEKAAHAGTLDPKVTGCLPTLLGEATRLAEALLVGEKEYIAVLELHETPPADLADVLSTFEGRIYQTPPRKSAVKRERRVREIHELTPIDRDGRQVLVRIRCESGTYIRKLCHDLGLALGTGAHMGDLRRTATTPFDDTDLVTLYDLTDAMAIYRSNGDEAGLRDVIAPAERALIHLPRVTIAPSAAREVANGAPVYAPGIITADVSTGADGTGEAEAAGEKPLVACFTPAGAAVCLGRLVGDPAADRGLVVDLERVLV